MLEEIMTVILQILNNIKNSAIEVIKETYEDITVFFTMIAEYFKSSEIKPYSKFFIGFSIFMSICGSSLLDIINIWFIGLIGGFVGAFIIIFIQVIYITIIEKKIDKEKKIDIEKKIDKE